MKETIEAGDIKTNRSVTFFFSGTGENASDIKDLYEKYKFDDQSIRIYFNGCQDNRIGGLRLGLGYISPDLDYVAKKIRACFTDSGELSLDQLAEQFGDAIVIQPNIKPQEPPLTTPSPTLSISEINLVGFSRGAVSTFSTARHLDDLKIPMKILAIDPVPGETRAQAKGEGTLYQKNYNLTQCKHLKQAEVMLGSYMNSISMLYNKYFRQMAPICGRQTAYHVFLTPKIYHREPSDICTKHIEAFLKKKTLSDFHKLKFYDNLYTPPKIIQQHVHNHADIIRLAEFSPLYKLIIFDKIQKKHPTITVETPFKIAQALLALYTYKQSAHDLEELFNIIQHDKTNKGKATREYIIEFNNILLFTQDFKRLTPDIKLKLDSFSHTVFTIVNQYSQLDSPSITNKEKLQTDILAQIELLNDVIPAESFKFLKETTILFLKHNALLHLNLAQFLTEDETFRESSQSMKDQQPLSPAMDIARQLFLSTQTERDMIYQQLQMNIPIDIKTLNFDELAEIIQFFSASQITEMLSQPSILSKIDNLERVNKLMGYMPTWEHRKALYKGIATKLEYHVTSIDIHLIELIKYLSINKCKQLCDKLSEKNLQMSTDPSFLHAIQTELEQEKRDPLYIIIGKWTVNSLLTTLAEPVFTPKDTAMPSKPVEKAGQVILSCSSSLFGPVAAATRGEFFDSSNTPIHQPTTMKK